MNNLWTKFLYGEAHVTEDNVVRNCIRTYNEEVEKRIASIKFISSLEVVKLVELGWASKELAELPTVLVKSLAANSMSARDYRKMIFPEEVSIVYPGQPVTVGLSCETVKKPLVPEEKPERFASLK